MIDLEKKLFPKSFERRIKENLRSRKSWGNQFADESFEKILLKLAK